MLTLAAAVAAAAAIILLVQAAFASPTVVTGFAGTSPAMFETIFDLTLFGALFAVAAAGLTAVRGWRGLIGPAWWKMGGAGLAIGIGGFALSAGLAALAIPPQHRAAGGSAGLLFGGTLVVLLQAVTEEVYFRGWLQPVLVRAWGGTAAVLVAATAFAALHLVVGQRTPLEVVNLLLGGLLFGLLALRSGGIAAAAAAHFGWNWMEAIGLGLSPNPGVGSFGAIVDLDLIGAPLWGGSADGLNASVAMTVVLVALLLPVAAWRLNLPARRG